MRLIPEIVACAPAMTAARRDLHAHPELGFEVYRTAELVANLLEQWDIPVHRGLGRSGVVGTVKAGSSARAIGLRADMDALPIQERNRFAHASRHAGRMHACGHDGHTAMLLAAAQYLANRRDFDGTVYLIFQPAEESGGGARAMIEDGLFEKFPMQAVFGMHNWPGLAAGDFALSTGPVMASSNEFKITLCGKGGHAAMPHMALDPVPVACQMVQSFQTIVSRNTRPIDAAVVSVTMIHAGQVSNVIPDRCELQGTVRTFSLSVLDMVEQRMRTIVHHMAAAYGMECSFEFARGYPPTINSDLEVACARRVLVDVVGAEHVQAQEPTMGAEDFSYMLRSKPGCYCFIGNGDGAAHADSHGDNHADGSADTGPCLLHNAHYDFNDALIPLGATYWVRLVESWLAVAKS